MSGSSTPSIRQILGNSFNASHGVRTVTSISTYMQAVCFLPPQIWYEYRSPPPWCLLFIRGPLTTAANNSDGKTICGEVCDLCDMSEFSPPARWISCSSISSAHVFNYWGPHSHELFAFLPTALHWFEADSWYQTESAPLICFFRYPYDPRPPENLMSGIHC